MRASRQEQWYLARWDRPQSSLSAALDIAARAEWLPRLGPTAYCLAVELMVRATQLTDQDRVLLGTPEQVGALIGMPSHRIGELSDALGALIQNHIVQLRPDGTLQSTTGFLGTSIPIDLRNQSELAKDLEAFSRRLTRLTDELTPTATTEAILSKLSDIRAETELLTNRIMLELADPDLVETLRTCQARAELLNNALRETQMAIRTQGELPPYMRRWLSEAAAGVIDWMATEFPVN